MFKYKYLSSFLLVLLFFVFQNLLGFLYTYFQVSSFNAFNYLQFDLFVTVLTLVIVLLIIKFRNISVVIRRIDNKDLVNFLILLIALCAIKILLDGLKYFESTISTRETIKPNDKLVLFLNYSFLKPITEELFFRALLLYVLIKNKLTLPKVLFATILFAVVHIHLGNYSNISYLLTIFLMGLFLLLIYLKYGIIYSVIGHFILNIISYINTAFGFSVSEYLAQRLNKMYFQVFIVFVLSILVFLFIKDFRQLKKREDKLIKYPITSSE